MATYCSKTDVKYAHELDNDVEQYLVIFLLQKMGY